MGEMSHCPIHLILAGFEMFLIINITDLSYCLRSVILKGALGEAAVFITAAS